MALLKTIAKLFFFAKRKYSGRCERIILPTLHRAMFQTHISSMCNNKPMKTLNASLHRLVVTIWYYSRKTLLYVFEGQHDFQTVFHSFLFLSIMRCRSTTVVLEWHCRVHLRALDTFGKCQRPIFAFGVSQHMPKITNLLKFGINW